MHVKLNLSCKLGSKSSVRGQFIMSVLEVHLFAVFDVLSVGRCWNLPAFKLTTEPNFSPSDSKEVSSWQRFEQGANDEIDCGKMMWAEGTHIGKVSEQQAVNAVMEISWFLCRFGYLPKIHYLCYHLQEQGGLKSRPQNPRSQILPIPHFRL